MGRRFPLTARLCLAIVLTLAVPVAALAFLSGYLQDAIRADEAQKVETTLDLAMHMEQGLIAESLKDMERAASLVASDPTVVAALAVPGTPLALSRFTDAMPLADLVVVVDRKGTVRSRATTGHTGDTFLLDGLVPEAMAKEQPLSYPALIAPGELQWESAALQERVAIDVVQDKTSADPARREGRALALTGVAPIRSESGAVIGAAIAADVLNRDFRIVDEISGWSPKDMPIDATIALDGLRVTTTVRFSLGGQETGQRALGTMYSDAVMEALRANRSYRGRADVVNRWQRTIYQPLTDYRGQVIAAPFVGIPEQYFTAVGQSLTRSLRVAAGAGSIALAVTLTLAVWLLIAGVVRPIRRFTAQLGQHHLEAAIAHRSNDEIGDLAKALAAMVERGRDILSRMRATSGEVSTTAEQLQESAALATGQSSRALSGATHSLQSATEMRDGSATTLTKLRHLEEAVSTVAEGARRQERAVQYIGRVSAEIATGLKESHEHMSSALEGIGRLTAGARTALKQAGDLTAGMALLRQVLRGAERGEQVLELVKDPSDVLANMAAQAERVAEEVRALALIIQENQARLAFINEEMVRVESVVKTTATGTQRTSESASAIIGWMDGLAGAAAEVATETINTHAALASAAEANQRLDSLVSRLVEEARRLREAVEGIE